MRKPYLFLYFSCFCWSIVAQSPNNDAIQALLKNAMEQSDVDINQALYFANTALQKADNEQNTFMIYESYRKLGAIMEDNNRLSEAKDFYAQALTISEKKEVPADRKLDILNEWVQNCPRFSSKKHRRGQKN
jgi:hypothetical protein